MKLKDLGRDGFREQVASGHGVQVQIGPLVIKVRIEIAPLVPLLYELWADYPLVSDTQIHDANFRLTTTTHHRRWPRRRIEFVLDGRKLFGPLPFSQHLPMLEWGVNWCIAKRFNHLLMLHAAVVERHGRAVILPAWPGHGKSTLCAALIHSGWRLFCDEFGLVRPEDGMLLPLPRLIPLKNESINVIRSFAPAAYLGPSFYGTRKGTIAHLRPPSESVRRMNELARPRWFIFPRWVPNASLQLEPMLKTEAFLMIATNAFNYEVLGKTAFESVAHMVEECECYSLVYSDLSQAVAALDDLTRLSNV